MKELSKQQKLVFDFIVKYWNENGISPSTSDVARGLDLGHSTVFAYIGALKRKGWLSSKDRTARSFTVLKNQRTITAGEPA